MAKQLDLIKGDRIGADPKKPTYITVICRPVTYRGVKYGDIANGAQVQIPAVVEVAPKTYESLQNFGVLWVDDERKEHTSVAQAEKLNKAE